MYGCGVNRCRCPFDGFLYTCLPQEAENGVCDFQSECEKMIQSYLSSCTTGGGFPFIAAIVTSVVLFVLALHHCLGFCTMSRDKTSELTDQAKSQLTVLGTPQTLPDVQLLTPAGEADRSKIEIDHSLI